MIKAERQKQLKSPLLGFLPANGTTVANGLLLTMWAQAAADARLFPHQVLFPMAGKEEGCRKLKMNMRAKLGAPLKILPMKSRAAV